MVYTSSPYVMPGAASVSAMPMTSYTTMPAMPMAYSTLESNCVKTMVRPSTFDEPVLCTLKTFGDKMAQNDVDGYSI